MTPQFITLKGGKRINTSYIIQYGPYFKDANKTWIEIKSFVEGENEVLEDMTTEQLDALMIPPSSPIVSPVPQVDSITYNGAVSFLFEGKRKHGVVDGFGITSIGPYMRICSDGVYYTHHFGQKDAFLDQRD